MGWGGGEHRAIERGGEREGKGTQGERGPGNRWAAEKIKTTSMGDLIRRKRNGLI
jgi:hypothetical protein